MIYKNLGRIIQFLYVNNILRCFLTEITISHYKNSIIIYTLPRIKIREHKVRELFDSFQRNSTKRNARLTQSFYFSQRGVLLSSAVYVLKLAFSCVNKIYWKEKCLVESAEGEGSLGVRPHPTMQSRLNWKKDLSGIAAFATQGKRETCGVERVYNGKCLWTCKVWRTCC